MLNEKLRSLTSSLSREENSLHESISRSTKATKYAALLALGLSAQACGGTDSVVFGEAVGGEGGSAMAGSGGMEAGVGGQGGSGGMETGGSGGESGECVDDDTQPCGTNEGLCEEGIQTCIDGTWGDCKGSVEPVLEHCGDNLDQDCDGEADNGCDVAVVFPTLISADCYKAVHFLSGSENIDANSSTPDSNICSKAGVSGFYQPGDRAQAWFEGNELEFESSEEPKSVEFRCSPFTVDPDWNDSTAAVQAMNYSALLQPNVVGQTYTYDLLGCDEYDIRITY